MTNSIFELYDLDMPGSGDLRFGDPRDNANRLLSKNILIACYQKEQSIEALSKTYMVPMAFMEDELSRLEGFLLRKKDNGKYLTNFIIITEDLQQEINEKIKDIMENLGEEIVVYLRQNEEKIMNMPYMAPPRDFSNVLWTMVPHFADMLSWDVTSSTLKRFNSVKKPMADKHFHIIGEVRPRGKTTENCFYGQNGTFADNYRGYKKVWAMNYMGRRIPWAWNRFGAAAYFELSPGLDMAIRAIGGVNKKDLEEKEKEEMAKAIEKGFVHNEHDILRPSIVIYDQAGEATRNSIFNGAQGIIAKYTEPFAKWLTDYIQKNVPEYLLDEIEYFIEMATNTGRHFLIEVCIAKGLLSIPKEEKCTEGIWMEITK